MTEKKKSLLASLLEGMKKNKKVELCVYLVIGLVIVVLYFAAGSGGNSEKEAEDGESVRVYGTDTTDAEEKLAQTLSQIRGVGKVTVMITYDTGTEIVPAMSKSTQSNESETQNGTSSSENESNEIATITSGGQESPVVITEIQPKVRGVIVVAEGAADISVKLNLEYATATVLGIDASAIEVFEMNAD